MTRFCVEDTVIERLKEQGLNATDLLRERTKIKKQKIEIVRRIVEVEDEEFIITYFDDKIEIIRK